MGTSNLNPFNKIKCSDDGSVKSLIFDQSSINIVQGANTLLSVSLKSLFLPVDEYSYEEFTLAAGANALLDSGNVVNDAGLVEAILILVEYPKLDAAGTNVETADKYITVSHGGVDMNMGKMLVLTGTATNGWDLSASPSGLVLTNPHTNFDVTVKVIFVA